MLYKCCDCPWKGPELVYKLRIDGLFQGHCPKCNRRYKGAVKKAEDEPEIQYTCWVCGALGTADKFNMGMTLGGVPLVQCRDQCRTT